MKKMFTLFLLSAVGFAADVHAASCPRNITGDFSICAGETNVLVHGSSGAASYQWFLNGAPLASSNSQTYPATMPGHYNCIVSDSCGTDSSGTGADVVVNQLPVVALSTPDDSLCPAEPAITLTGSPAGGTLSGPGISGMMFTPFNAGPGTHTISYTYIDTNACAGSDSVVIFIYPIVNVNITASDYSVCLDDADVVLNGSPSGGFYNGTGVNGNMFEPSTAGAGMATVIYVYTDLNGCNFGAATGINVNACVGIEEQAAGNGTVLFPNPANGNATITVNEISSVMILNSIGQTVINLQLTEGNHPLDLTAFAEGIYFVRTQNVNGISTQRLIITH